MGKRGRRAALRRALARVLVEALVVRPAEPLDGADRALWALRVLQRHRDGATASERAARAAGDAHRAAAAAHLAAADAVEVLGAEVASAHRDAAQAWEMLVG